MLPMHCSEATWGRIKKTERWIKVMLQWELFEHFFIRLNCKVNQTDTAGPRCFYEENEHYLSCQIPKQQQKQMGQECNN